MTVRRANLTDLDVLVDFWVALVAGQRPHGAHLLADENRQTARDFLGQYVAADGVDVAERDGELVGFVNYRVESGAYEQDADRGIVDNVFVRPADRDEGVGSRLLDSAEAALIDRGVDVVAVSVMADNEAARRLYERHDYRPHRVTMEKPVDTESNRDASPDT